MPKRFFLTISLLCTFFVLVSSEVKASILSVEKDGGIVWKVLSEQDDSSLDVPTHSYIEVKRVADSDVSTNSSIELTKTGDKMNLYVFDDNERREIDITKVEGDIVEIEERPEIQRISLSIKDNKFRLKQKGFFALTEYPIKVDPETAKFTVGTNSGDRFLSIMPYEIVQGVLRSKIISRVNDNTMEIIEEGRELQYSFSGEKVFNIFDFFEYSIPVSLRVSATTGETVSIEGPDWYKVIGFFLS